MRLGCRIISITASKCWQGVCARGAGTIPPEVRGGHQERPRKPPPARGPSSREAGAARPGEMLAPRATPRGFLQREAGRLWRRRNRKPVSSVIPPSQASAKEDAQPPCSPGPANPGLGADAAHRLLLEIKLYPSPATAFRGRPICGACALRPRRWVVATETIELTSSKYLLSGPLQIRFAAPELNQ